MKVRKALMIRIPADVHRKIRHLAIEEDTTVTDLVLKMFEERFARPTKKGAAAGRLPVGGAGIVTP